MRGGGRIPPLRSRRRMSNATVGSRVYLDRTCRVIVNNLVDHLYVYYDVINCFFFFETTKTIGFAIHLLSIVLTFLLIKSVFFPFHYWTAAGYCRNYFGARQACHLLKPSADISRCRLD